MGGIDALAYRDAVAELQTARTGALLVQHRNDLVALLNLSYGIAPWFESPDENVREAQHMVDSAVQAGVRTAVLLSEGRLVGVAQGGPGVAFLAYLRGASAADAQRLPAHAFEFRQLALDPHHTGLGLGARLHDAVMDDVYGPALLVTHPEAAPALRLYGRRHWRIVGRMDFGTSHPRVILGRDLASR